MKKILIVCLALIMAVPTISMAQELSKSEQRKLEKQLKKEKQAEEAKQKMVLVELMVEHQTFVLEADRLRDKRGQTVNVPSMLNFIACDSIEGVIQIGSNQYVGMNGVGGITIEGPVTNYEYEFNEKNGTYSVNYNIRSSTGNYDVRMTIYGEGRADATVSSNWPGRVSYSGLLVLPLTSRVYKGTSRY